MVRDRRALRSRSRRWGRRVTWLVLGAVPAGFVGVLMVWPLVTIVRRGLVTGDAAVLGEAWMWRVAWFTTWQAAVSTLLTLALGLPISYVIARFRFPGRALLRGLVTVPFVLPTVVVSAAFLAVFDRFGLDEGSLRMRHTVWAVLAAHVFFNLSVVVRTVGGVWSQLDPRMEESARMLGASPWRAFRRITLPRLAPALWASGAIVFAFCFTSFGIILLLGGPANATIETEIWRYAMQRARLDVATVLALVQLGAVLAALAANVVLARRGRGTERPAPAERVARRPVTWRQRLLVGSVAALVGVVVGLPVAALVERSLSVGEGYGIAHYRSLFTSGADVPGFVVPARDAIVGSLTIAVVATAIALVVGAATAVVALRSRRLVSLIAEVAVLVPLGVSTVVLGLGYLITFDRPPLDLRSSWIILPLAHALIGLPFVVRVVVSVLRSLDDRLRDAAAVLGASPARVVTSIDLPLGGRALAIGAGFAFAVSLGEFGATSFLARPATPTVPLAIFRLLGRPGAELYGQAMALSVILMVLTGASLLAFERVRGRGDVGF